MIVTSEELSHRTKEVLEALERRETVSLYVRRKLKGYIVPADKPRTEVKVVDHPFFGSRSDDQKDVKEVVNRLRASRHEVSSLDLKVFKPR